MNHELVLPATDKTVYVPFLDEINPATAARLIATMGDLANQHVPDVRLLLSTPGGRVMHGMTLFNMLKAVPFNLTVHNVGNVDSIGNVVFLAVKTRYACPQATFMFHGVGLNVPRHARLEERMLCAHLDSIVRDQDRIGSVLRERTQLPADFIDALFREEKTLDATFAAKCGIVHEIRDIDIPLGSPLLSLAFQG